MAAEVSLLALSLLFVIALQWNQLESVKENREDILDLNTHTHAADGSINGIRGWY